jgi:hypothetical protein
VIERILTQGSGVACGFDSLLVDSGVSSRTWGWITNRGKYLKMVHELCVKADPRSSSKNLPSSHKEDS